MPYGGSPATNVNDALKFLVGDQSTSASGELLSTGECTYLIAQHGSVRNAAPYAALAIAADLADQVSKAVGDLRIELQQKYEHYTSLSEVLRRSVALKAVVPFAGGISYSDKQDRVADTDNVRPAFSIGQFDSPLIPGGRTTST